MKHLSIISIIIISFIVVSKLHTSPISVVCGGTSRTSVTAYAVLCGGTFDAGALQVASPGASGRYLLSNGAGALPTFQTLSFSITNSVTLFQTQTASSSSSLVFLVFIDGSSLILVTFNALVPSTSAVLNMDFSTDSGSTYISSGYTSGYLSHSYNSATLSNTTSTTTCPLGGSTSTVVSGYVLINISASGGSGIAYLGQGMYGTTGIFTELFGVNLTGNINAIKFSMSAGTISSGTISVYKVKLA